ncbi:C-24(28) sterol reductase [Marasmius crinis-equi]|uniref:C-24(28) sterol reductase n=1 Tax=Marasmius crinis-equi TaxID=585013 RepID=A0ABR3EZ24_9AGAR
MDQDDFRTLLSTTSQKSGASSSSRGSLLTQPRSKQKTTVTSSSEAAFKPRKVKKTEKYRDRATERRQGEGNDYAQVEAVLEEFERSTADQDKQSIDEKRRYLGGDEEHSVLVKGLDMALLERNKAKEAVGKAAEEDDELERAFLNGGKSSTSEVPAPSGKKRTREDIIRELKNKKAGADSTSQEAELNKGKFKPIGFKPIGAPAEDKAKKRKVKGDGEKKKKKRKVVEDATGDKEKAVETAARKDESTPALEGAASASSPPKGAEKEREPEPDMPDDFDIFADAGEYEGLGDDEEDDHEGRSKDDKKDGDVPLANTKLRPGRWFADDQEEEPSKPEPPAGPSQSLGPSAGASTSTQPPPRENEEGEVDEEEEEGQMRLMPLSGSALPSIKDFLAMDEAAEKAEKKKKRKEKQKNKQGGGEMTAEARADRDYKRLKSFTDKRGA